MWISRWKLNNMEKRIRNLEKIILKCDKKLTNQNAYSWNELCRKNEDEYDEFDKFIIDFMNS